jgi:hypothetical protein
MLVFLQEEDDEDGEVEMGDADEVVDVVGMSEEQEEEETKEDDGEESGEERPVPRS